MTPIQWVIVTPFTFPEPRLRAERQASLEGELPQRREGKKGDLYSSSFGWTKPMGRFFFGSGGSSSPWMCSNRMPIS